ncbi:MAG: hypothetical protein ACR2PU_02625 [Gammaproteobacteria bacterium]
MKQKGFNLFGVMPATKPEIQDWIENVAPGISQLQKEEFARQWYVIEEIRQTKKDQL